MVKTVTDSGVEIRVYSNKRGIVSCGGTGFLSYSNFNTFQACSAGLVGCDGIFYIRDGKVIEVKAVGNCYTNEKSRPEKGWETESNARDCAHISITANHLLRISIL